MKNKLKNLVLMVWSLLFVVPVGYCASSNTFSLQTFKPQVGDLLFQELNWGTLCNGIDKVTYGVDDSVISHVAMVINATPGKEQVVEAVSNGVVAISLKKFLARNLDAYGKPRVIVGRLTPEYHNLIPVAVSNAKSLIGKPYNSCFMPRSKGYYCSQLIATAFQRANHNHPVFVSHPMNFQDEKTGQLVPAWQQYFKEQHCSVPQGLMGTNPGALSRAPIISIVYHYGELNKHDTQVKTTKLMPGASVRMGQRDISFGVTVFRSQSSN